jgi:hypothetical protein
MRYSIWRNDAQVAELVVPFHTAQKLDVSGMVRPDDRFADILPITQMRIWRGGEFETHLLQAQENDSRVPTAQAALSAGNSVAIQADEALQLRDAYGNIVAARIIMIKPVNIPNGNGEFPDACHAAGLFGIGWSIYVRLAEDNGAPM